MIMESYIGFVLGDKDRRQLAKLYPPKYPKFIGHHITYKFGVGKDTSLPKIRNVIVVGHIDSEDGIEALVCQVNGSIKRPDNSIYHITWSLDPSKYKPEHSNKLLASKPYDKLPKPIIIGGKVKML